MAAALLSAAHYSTSDGELVYTQSGRRETKKEPDLFLYLFHLLVLRDWPSNLKENTFSTGPPGL